MRRIAEDRALATFLLEEEQRIVFQRNAIAYTTLPADYRTTCGMLLRWGRGDVRGLPGGRVAPGPGGRAAGGLPRRPPGKKRKTGKFWTPAVKLSII